MLKLLIMAGADINVKDKFSRTPLYEAIDSKKEDVILTLVEHGAQLDWEDSLERAPLYLALLKNLSSSVIKYMVEAKADLNPKNGSKKYIPLNQAVYKGNKKAVKILLEAKANPNSINVVNETPLHEAATKKNILIINDLISFGADINARSLYYRTPPDKIIDEIFRPKVINSGLEDYKAHSPVIKILISHGNKCKYKFYDKDDYKKCNVYEPKIPEMEFQFLLKLPKFISDLDEIASGKQLEKDMLFPSKFEDCAAERIAKVVKNQNARDKDNFKKSLESSKVYLQKSFYNSILECLKAEGEYIKLNLNESFRLKFK